MERGDGMDVERIVEELRLNLPPIFLGSKIAELTGHAVNWGTIQNKRARRAIPNEEQIFVRSGNRVLVLRDPFLWWFATTLTRARQPATPPPPRRERRAPPAGERDRPSR
jgi:hypothetical protein